MSISARIARIEYAVPNHVVTNDDLQRAHPEWRMELVARKTGVLTRRFAAEDELASDLAFQAATEVLGGYDADEIDGLIFCTQSPDQIMPPNATILHARLGLRKSVAAFDITLACSGFVYGLAIAKSMIDSMRMRSILLVCGDTYSRYIHPDDRAALTLFGDGAAAALVDRSTAQSGILDCVLASDGQSGGDKFMIKAGGLRTPRSEATCVGRRDIAGNVRSDDTIYMDGAAVLAFAQREVQPTVEHILRRNNLQLAEVKLVLFHQASLHALNILSEQLDLTPDQTFSNIAHLGNTVSASLPILLKDAQSAGRLEREDLVLIVGFGVGFSWGACLMRW
ncbi:MAG TPA: ketoacyl-ACP synthase III [Gemmatimonadaceae bacterium]|nr:ketoacyl-ACP synthase III [Gemmatimonadaceae bacterium]